MPKKILTMDECIDHLIETKFGRLATSADNQPYITPVNYLYRGERIYIHCGFKGRKIDNIKKNPRVCFEISQPTKFVSSSKASGFTYRFWSVLVTGNAGFVSDPEEKLDIMNAFMDKYAHDLDFEPLSITDMKFVQVIELIISEMTGKAGIDPE